MPSITSIYNARKSSFSAEPQNKPLSSIMKDIKAPVYAKLINKIKNGENHLKKSLPTFKTCLDVDGNPNGLVHFDIDVKDNKHLNFQKLKADLVKIPEVIFCFYSPRGGLKVAVKSDFKGGEHLKERFKIAYKISKAHLQQYINDEVIFDDSCRSIFQDCFVSFDDDLYFKPDCETLKLNDKCVHVQPDYSRLATDNRISESFIKELLSFIPADLKYDERLPVNYAVLNEMGEAGIPLLLSHWNTCKTKLESNLKSQLNNLEYGNIATLIKIARQYGYTFKKVVKDSTHKFTSLLTVDEAKPLLKEAVSNFFDNGVSTFLNVSAGFGKTSTMLEVLKKLPFGKQVLILTPSHKLADEIIESYRKISNINKKLTPFEKVLQRGKNITGITHIKGKVHYKNPEHYKNQFNSVANIRVLTHEEYSNEKAKYWYGNFGDYTPPKNGNKKPDYIIVDENFLKRSPIYAKLETDYSSLRNIINGTLDGETLEQAVKDNIGTVIKDYHTAKKVKYPVKNVDETKTSYNERLKVFERNKQELQILKALIDGEFNRLKVIDQLKELHYFKMNKVHSRYAKVPTLYLDATANKAVINKLLPDVKYVDLAVKQADDINVYMASDFNVSKNWLKKTDNRSRLVKMLKTTFENNPNIGFITYKNVEGIPDFDQWVSSQTGIKNYNHFGNLRGSNQFEDVDELFVIGRQYLKVYEYENLARAVFGVDVTDEQEWLESNIRIKDGSARSIMNKRFVNNEVQLVKHHFADSETVQAIGRGRLIHGKRKDVYLLSNEALQDVEITDFITEDEIIPKVKYSSEIERAIEQGYCKFKRAELLELGFNESQIKRSKEKIEKEFLTAGFEFYQLEIKDKHRNKTKSDYFIINESKFAAHLQVIGATLP